MMTVTATVTSDPLSYTTPYLTRVSEAWRRWFDTSSSCRQTTPTIAAVIRIYRRLGRGSYEQEPPPSGADDVSNPQELSEFGGHSDRQSGRRIMLYN